MSKKIVGVFLLLVMVFGTVGLSYADQKEAKSVSIEEQFVILKEYMKSLEENRSVGNEINYLSCEEGCISIGIQNSEDEEFKNDIFSLPGIDSEKLRFVEFKIVWYGYEPYEEGHEESCEEDYEIMRATYSMGSVIDMGDGYATLGCPTDSSGKAFYTANHGITPLNRIVKCNGTDVGVVDKISFTGCTDISRVNVSSYGNTISASLYDYSGSVSLMQQVTAYAGRSGTIGGFVRAPSATVNGPGGAMYDMIVVQMQAQSGDSGSCLVTASLYGDIAVGILSFAATLDGNPVAVFTKITNI